jgi:hypothetical protein
MFDEREREKKTTRKYGDKLCVTGEKAKKRKEKEKEILA